jgi:hypothetical protein
MSTEKEGCLSLEAIANGQIHRAFMRALFFFVFKIFVILGIIVAFTKVIAIYYS